MQELSNPVRMRTELCATQPSQWKKDALAHLAQGFADGRSVKQPDDDEALKEKLYSQIGKLKVELDWLKKNLQPSVERRKENVDSEPSPC